VHLNRLSTSHFRPPDEREQAFVGFGSVFRNCASAAGTPIHRPPTM
jgi:hypothetical protein